MDHLKFFVLFSTDGKPQELNVIKQDIDASDRFKFRGPHEFEGSLPLPLPDFLLIFALGEWPQDDCFKQMCAQLHLGKDLDPFHIGTLSKDNRAICWQGTWREDLQVRGVLMSDEEQPGLLVITPASPKPVLDMQEGCSSQDTTRPIEIKDSPPESTSRNTSNPADDLETMETSQTESQLMDFMPDLETAQENSGREVKGTGMTEYCTNIGDKESPPKNGRRRSKMEVTPEVEVQCSQPPVMSHSSRKKRKADLDQSTPRGQMRVKRLQMQQRSQNRMTESPSHNRTPGKARGDSSVPSARWGHSMCAISKKQALVIGGQGNHQVLSKDSVWLLDTESMSWCVPGIIQTDSVKPQYRMGHTAVYDPQVKSVYVYGGSKNLRWYSDIHVLDIESWRWSMVKAAGRAPTRAYHTSTLYRSEMYVFGGVYPNPDPEPDSCSNQLHVYSPATESWYEPLVIGTKPKARSGHSATLLGDTLVIFGGWDAPECFNDVHCLDLTLMEYTNIPVIGTPPSPRSWHASTVLPGNRVLIQGGFDGENAMSDSFVFRLESRCWTKLLWPLPATPTAGHTVLTINHQNNLFSDDDADDKENETWADARRQQKLVVFGGGDNEGTFSNKLITLKLQLPSS